MPRCTAPVNGHRSANAAENCPACRGGYRSNSSFSSYSSTSSHFRNEPRNFGNSRSSRNKPKWSKHTSTVVYTPADIRTLTPLRENFEKRSSIPDLRDIFLCHAWDDRKGAAKELHDLIESQNASVWFSEKDVLLGTPLLREIDKGLANSRVGIVLVTPAFLSRIKGEGIADKELSFLLSRDLLHTCPPPNDL